jgi:acyl-CoA thioesterase
VYKAEDYNVQTLSQGQTCSLRSVEALVAGVTVLIKEVYVAG